MKIQNYINSRNKYKIDYTYQRPNDAWSLEDKQCLIDTILRGEPLPIFFLNFISDKGIYFVVDGQQRLNCIEQFYDNKIKLNEKFSGKKLAGLTFNGENALNDADKDAFLGYDLKTHIMEDYDDERVRLIFSRLQRGKPLALGERLNAKPGTVVELMREIAKHPFLEKSIGVAKNRYGVYPDAARLLFYEKLGAKQCGSEQLYTFFDDFQSLDKKSREFKNVQSVLNYLEKAFPPEPGDYQYLEKHAWVFAVFTMVRELKLSYSIVGQEENLQKFIIEFHSKVYSEDFRKSKTNYQKFYDNVRGGWSEKIIALRRDILIKKFLLKFNLDELDEKRQITDEEKIAIFAKQQVCQRCGCQFKDYREAEYHHIKKYIDGGRSEIDNIQMLCRDCHDIIHGNSNFTTPSESEIEEIE